MVKNVELSLELVFEYIGYINSGTQVIKKNIKLVMYFMYLVNVHVTFDVLYVTFDEFMHLLSRIKVCI